jgi:quercetin 2,3-dioxygenase
MITRYPHDQLGHVEFDWLDTRHHFSFGHYHDPKRMGFGDLRVINDDLIAPASGFDPHPHRDMEIITYVREGTVIHKDSLGNEGRTGAGDVQVMSAGTGIIHAEYSDPDQSTKLFQIWILPDKRGIAPRWDQAQFPKGPVEGALKLLVSGDERDTANGALFINADARIYGGVMPAGSALTHPVRAQAYVLASRGSVRINDVVLLEGDGAEVTGLQQVALTAAADAEVLVIDVRADSPTVIA